MNFRKEIDIFEGHTIDLCIVLSALSLIFALFGVVGYRPPVLFADEAEKTETKPEIRSIFDIYKLLDIKAAHKELMRSYDYEEELKKNVHLEETPEFSAVLYAVEPIGRYFITAYNDEETNCKTTASGTRCHEGTITTCAADVWGGYFKFGDYIEVDGRLFRVEDTGSAVKKRHIDIFFDDYKKMAKYGSNYQTIYRVTFPFGKPQD